MSKEFDRELVAARKAVMDKYSSLLHPAIKRGEWDKGSLVQGELARIQAATQR